MAIERSPFENALSMRWFTPRGRLVVESLCEALAGGREEELTALLEPLRRRGVDDSRLDLRGVNLDGASLAGAYLAHVDLSYASLVGCDLTGATLSDSVLWGAHLQRASLHGAVLVDADLSAADLVCADLSYADLTRARLAGANLGGASTEGAELTEVNWGAYALDPGAPADAAEVGLGKPPRIEPLPANSRWRRPSRRVPRPRAPRVSTRRVGRPPVAAGDDPAESGRLYSEAHARPQVENHVEQPESKAERRRRLDALLSELDSWFPRSA